MSQRTRPSLEVGTPGLTTAEGTLLDICERIEVSISPAAVARLWSGLTKPGDCAAASTASPLRRFLDAGYLQKVPPPPEIRDEVRGLERYAPHFYVDEEEAPCLRLGARHRVECAPGKAGLGAALLARAAVECCRASVHRGGGPTHLVEAARLWLEAHSLRGGSPGEPDTWAQLAAAALARAELLGPGDQKSGVYLGQLLRRSKWLPPGEAGIVQSRATRAGSTPISHEVLFLPVELRAMLLCLFAQRYGLAPDSPDTTRTTLYQVIEELKRRGMEPGRIDPGTVVGFAPGEIDRFFAARVHRVAWSAPLRTEPELLAFINRTGPAEPVGHALWLGQWSWCRGDADSAARALHAAHECSAGADRASALSAMAHVELMQSGRAADRSKVAIVIDRLKLDSFLRKLIEDTVSWATDGSLPARARWRLFGDRDDLTSDAMPALLLADLAFRTEGQGELAAAEILQSSAVHLLRCSESSGRLALAVFRLGVLRLMRNDVERAREALFESLSVWRRGHTPWLSRTLDVLARCATVAGNAAEAERWQSERLGLTRPEDRGTSVDPRIELAVIHLHAHQLDPAIEAARRAVEAAEQLDPMDHRREMLTGRARAVRARVRMACGDVWNALTDWIVARRSLRAAGATIPSADESRDLPILRDRVRQARTKHRAACSRKACSKCVKFLLDEALVTEVLDPGSLRAMRSAPAVPRVRDHQLRRRYFEVTGLAVDVRRPVAEARLGRMGVASDLWPFWPWSQLGHVDWALPWRRPTPTAVARSVFHLRAAWGRADQAGRTALAHSLCYGLALLGSTVPLLELIAHPACASVPARPGPAAPVHGRRVTCRRCAPRLGAVLVSDAGPRGEITHDILCADARPDRRVWQIHSPAPPTGMLRQRLTLQVVSGEGAERLIEAVAGAYNVSVEPISESTAERSGTLRFTAVTGWTVDLTSMCHALLDLPHVLGVEFGQRSVTVRSPPANQRPK